MPLHLQSNITNQKQEILLNQIRTLESEFQLWTGSAERLNLGYLSSKFGKRTSTSMSLSIRLSLSSKYGNKLDITIHKRTLSFAHLIKVSVQSNSIRELATTSQLSEMLLSMKSLQDLINTIWQQ